MARERFPSTVHTIYKSALAVARVEDRPPQPWHLGGARPVCPARGQISIAVALAELFAHRATPTQRRQLASILAAVRRFLAGKDAGRALRELSTVEKGSSPLAIACNAAGAAATLARGKADLVHTGAQAAASKAVALAGPGEPTRRLLEALDQEILRWECEDAFSEFGPAGRSPVERVLWRAADAKGRTAHWIARLEGGRCAAVVKLVHGKRAAWHEGTPEEIVSIVPEALFKGAVGAVVAGAARPTALLSTLRL